MNKNCKNLFINSWRLHFEALANVLYEMYLNEMYIFNIELASHGHIGQFNNT